MGLSVLIVCQIPAVIINKEESYQNYFQNDETEWSNALKGKCFPMSILPPLFCTAWRSCCLNLHRALFLSVNGDDSLLNAKMYENIIIPDCRLLSVTEEEDSLVKYDAADVCTWISKLGDPNSVDDDLDGNGPDDVQFFPHPPERDSQSEKYSARTDNSQLVRSATIVRPGRQYI